MFKKLKKRIEEAVSTGYGLEQVENEVIESYEKGKITEDQYNELMSML